MKATSLKIIIPIILLLTDGFTGVFFPSNNCPTSTNCGIFYSVAKSFSGSGSTLTPKTDDIVREELRYAEQKFKDDPVLSSSNSKFLSEARLNVVNIAADADSRVKETNIIPNDDKAIRRAVIVEIASAYSEWLKKRVEVLSKSLLESGEKIFPKEPDIFNVLTFIDSMKGRYSAGNDLFSVENVLPGDVKTEDKFDILPVSFTIDTSYGTLLKFLEDLDDVGDLNLQKTQTKITPLFDITSIKILPKDETVRTDDVRAEVAAIFYFQKVDNIEITKAKDEYQSSESTTMDLLNKSPEKKTAEIEGLLTRIDKEKQAVVQLDQKNTRELLKKYQNLKALWDEVKSRI